jgi:hypothetical protein
MADYHGRADAAHALGLISRVLEDIEETGEWISERETVSAFAAQANGEHCRGCSASGATGTAACCM